MPVLSLVSVLLRRWNTGTCLWKAENLTGHLNPATYKHHLYLINLVTLPVTEVRMFYFSLPDLHQEMEEASNMRRFHVKFCPFNNEKSYQYKHKLFMQVSRLTVGVPFTKITEMIPFRFCVVCSFYRWHFNTLKENWTLNLTFHRLNI